MSKNLEKRHIELLQEAITMAERLVLLMESGKVTTHEGLPGQPLRDTSLEDIQKNKNWIDAWKQELSELTESN